MLFCNLSLVTWLAEGAASRSRSLSVDLDRPLLRHNMEDDLGVYLRAIFAAGQDRTAGFCCAISNIVEMQSATLSQKSLPILAHVDCGLVALGSKLQVTRTFGPLGPGEAPLSSVRVE